MSSSINYSSQIQGDANQILALLETLKQEDSKSATQKVLAALIAYIQANISKDAEGGQGGGGSVKDAEDNLNKAMDQYGKDMTTVGGIEAKVKEIMNNPSDQTADNLQYLENLLAAAKQDAVSGDLSNLSNFLS